MERGGESRKERIIIMIERDHHTLFLFLLASTIDN